MSAPNSPISDASEDVVLPEQLALLSSRLEDGPETLAVGNKDIQLAALQATKYVFDLGMSSVYCVAMMFLYAVL